MTFLIDEPLSPGTIATVISAVARSQALDIPAWGARSDTTSTETGEILV